jgi:hypothetical protein
VVVSYFNCAWILSFENEKATYLFKGRLIRMFLPVITEVTIPRLHPLIAPLEYKMFFIRVKNLPTNLMEKNLLTNKIPTLFLQCILIFQSMGYNGLM